MIRLTLLYNLPEGQSEAAFLKWRLSEHQENNAAMPGVQRTDFARIDDIWPGSATPNYRFQTIVEWPDRASFDAGFYNENVQTKLKTDLQRLGDHVFVISEVLVDSGSSP
ncbi:MAG: hypothetical protein AB8G16_01815 [Gammaproteobacteria bacterium]